MRDPGTWLLLAAALTAGCTDASPAPVDATAVDARADAASDATTDALAPADAPFDAAPDAPPVETAAPGFRVTLGVDGQLRIETGGVALPGFDVVLRLADGTERALADMTRAPDAGTNAVSGRSADGWSLAVSVAAVDPARPAVRLSWRVEGAGALRGVMLRSRVASLPADTRVTLDGAQSWSFTGSLALPAGTLRPRDAQGRLAWPSAPGDVSGDAPGVGYFRGDVAWSAGGLSVCAEPPYDRWTALVAERPSTQWQVQVSTGVTSDETVALRAGGAAHTGSWILAPADVASPFACVGAIPRAPRSRPPSAFPRGWWSWNTFFSAITADRVRAQVPSMLALDARARHVTLDDGWERAWGDWSERDGFGGTLAGLATELRAQGVTLGLWLAPFVVDPATTVATAHPDWLLHDAAGAVLQFDLVPGRHYAVLDLTVPAAREHLRALFADLRARGIALFKIDYLYAGALPAVRANPALTGLQAYQLGLAAIAEGAAGAHLNGCGAVIPPALGFVDSMRVGADDTYETTPPFWAAAAAAARNLGARALLSHDGVQPDPDQPVVRGLTLDEGRAFLAMGALSGGAFGYGDDLTALDAPRAALLREPWFTQLRDGLTEPATPLDAATSVATRFALNPLLDGAAGRFRSTFAYPPSVWLASLAGGTTEAVLFNWRDDAATLTVPAGALGARVTERVAGDTATASSTGAWSVTVPPHGVRVLQTSP